MEEPQRSPEPLPGISLSFCRFHLGEREGRLLEACFLYRNITGNAEEISLAEVNFSSEAKPRLCFGTENLKKQPEQSLVSPFVF